MRDMFVYGLRYATRCTAPCVAALGLFLALQGAADAGEVVTRDCLHGSASSYSTGYRNSSGDEYAADYGNGYGDAYSYSRPHRGEVRTGFGGRFHRGFANVAGDDNGGGSINGANAGSQNGHRDGYDSGYANGATTAYGSDSCVEIRRELTNPHVIQVPPPASEAEAREVERTVRLWRAHCHPAIRQDRYGVSRYVYAAPGCEFGKYE
jgi:hypothetical protein